MSCLQIDDFRRKSNLPQCFSVVLLDSSIGKSSDCVF